MPIMTIYAGMNGAGKSTLHNFQKQLGEPDLGVRICPDEILQDFEGDWKSYRDVVASGKLSLDKINFCLKNKISFNWETTLIGFLTFKFVEQAREQGFIINLNFIGVDDVNLSLNRISQRVFEGGHGVNENLVRFRHAHQLNNLNELLPLVDNAIFYNNVETMQVVATYYNNNLNIYNNESKWIKTLETTYNTYKSDNSNINNEICNPYSNNDNNDFNL